MLGDILEKVKLQANKEISGCPGLAPRGRINEPKPHCTLRRDVLRPSHPKAPWPLVAPLDARRNFRAVGRSPAVLWGRIQAPVPSSKPAGHTAREGPKVNRVWWLIGAYAYGVYYRGRPQRGRGATRSQSRRVWMQVCGRPCSLFTGLGRQAGGPPAGHTDRGPRHSGPKHREPTAGGGGCPGSPGPLPGSPNLLPGPPRGISHHLQEGPTALL